MFLSGLIPRPMSADDDHRLLDHGIGFTNVVERATKGSANISRKEIVVGKKNQELKHSDKSSKKYTTASSKGTQALLEKIRTFRPKIAVFNGKGIYEVFSGKKDFHFGKQPDLVEGTNTVVQAVFQTETSLEILMYRVRQLNLPPDAERAHVEHCCLFRIDS